MSLTTRLASLWFFCLDWLRYISSVKIFDVRLILAGHGDSSPYLFMVRAQKNAMMQCSELAGNHQLGKKTDIYDDDIFRMYDAPQVIAKHLEAIHAFSVCQILHHMHECG